MHPPKIVTRSAAVGCARARSDSANLAADPDSRDLLCRLHLIEDWCFGAREGYGVNSLMGRTSMLPSRAGGIFEATWIASFKSLASIR